MALKPVKPNGGHARGVGGGRWMPREEAKVSSRKKRRREDKCEEGRRR